MPYFVKLKDLTCNFCGFYHFFLFLSQFLSELDENYIKNLDNFRPTRLLSRFGHRTTVFSGPCSDKMEGLGLRSGPMRSLGPDI